MDLTQNEKKLLMALGPLGSADPSRLAKLLSAPEEAVIQYAYLLQDRGLAIVERKVVKHFALTGEGRNYAEHGLPERQLLESFGESIPMAELTRHPLAKIGIGQMRRKGWITIRDGMV
ncbi:MAG: phenylalanine--tRNA ligase subunit alpha, partial [Methanoregulaceae archaeon]|nr:phenylalanine--tRNA ligase subunit alpha [Methanoregulaceae archaeon]